MKEIKREFMPMYSFYDRDGIADHLEQMAAKGWLLEKMSAWCWTYRRIEPKNISFAVTFFPKATQFDPQPIEGLETFREFCAEAGWIHTADNGQMQVFYNEQPHPTPMETDPAADLANIHRAMKGFLSTYRMLLALGLLEMLFLLWQGLQRPIQQFSNPAHLNALFAFLPTVLLAGVELWRYSRWRKRAAEAVELGEPLPQLRSARWLQRLIWVMVLIELVILFGVSGAASADTLLALIFMLVMLTLTVFLANSISKTLRRMGARAWVNRLVSLGVVVAMTVGIMAGMVAIIFKAGDLFPNPDVVETYEHYGITWEVYADPLPLTIQDLTETDYTQWSTRLTTNSSPLLTHMEAVQRPRMDALDQPDLEYEVVIVKAPFLYDLCKQQYIDWVARDNDKLPPEHWDEYRPIDAVPWGAAEAYQRYGSGEPINQFLICWHDRIAEVHFDWDWDITPEMMTITAEKLKSA